MANTYHWDKFYLHLYYQTSVEKLFRAWSTAAGLESFFIKNCDITRGKEKVPKDEVFMEGDLYNFTWDDLTKTQGEVYEVEESSHMSFSFGKDTVIKVSMKEDDKGVLQTLKHSGIPGSLEEQQIYQLDCRVGWTYYLSNLRAVIEKSIDIRDVNPACAGTLSWGTYPPDGLELD